MLKEQGIKILIHLLLHLDLKVKNAKKILMKTLHYMMRMCDLFSFIFFGYLYFFFMFEMEMWIYMVPI